MDMGQHFQNLQGTQRPPFGSPSDPVFEGGCVLTEGRDVCGSCQREIVPLVGLTTVVL